MRTGVTIALAAGFLAWLGGCGAIGYMMIPHAPTKTVPAEYAGMPGHKLAIVVYTHESTQYAEPRLAADLSAYVQDALTRNISKVSFVERSKIAHYQDTHAYWSSAPPGTLGREFGAEMELAVYVDYYSPTQPGDLFYQQGRLTCQAKLFDVTGDGRPVELWNKTKMSVTYPPKEYGTGISTDAAKTRDMLLRTFSEKLANCFRKHQEPKDAEET